MVIKGLIDEDFVNYKKPSMYIAFPSCTFKCCTEGNLPIEACQNCKLAKAKNIKISAEQIVERFVNNPITSAMVVGGMEPFDSWEDLLYLVKTLRKYATFDCVIYTGYNKEEIKGELLTLKQFPNIIVKFGRYQQGHQPHYDDVLGVNLISDNQFAERIS